MHVMDADDMFGEFSDTGELSGNVHSTPSGSSSEHPTGSNVSNQSIPSNNAYCPEGNTIYHDKTFKAQFSNITSDIITESRIFPKTFARMIVSQCIYLINIRHCDLLAASLLSQSALLSSVRTSIPRPEVLTPVIDKGDILTPIIDKGDRAFIDGSSFLRSSAISNVQCMEAIKETISINASLGMVIDPLNEAFVTQIVGTYCNKYSLIDKMIRQHIKAGWQFENIDMNIVSVICAGVSEAISQKRTLAQIILKEHVVVAQMFFDDKECAFVNAILDKIIKSIRTVKPAEGA